jgi:hypothetical protein
MGEFAVIMFITKENTKNSTKGFGVVLSGTLGHVTWEGDEKSSS